jgi:hypothetical protein
MPKKRESSMGDDPEAANYYRHSEPRIPEMKDGQAFQKCSTKKAALTSST